MVCRYRSDRRIMANETCTRCGTQEEIVHSGVDGIWLGVLDELHKICYPCGNKVMLDRQEEQ